MSQLLCNLFGTYIKWIVELVQLFKRAGALRGKRCVLR